MDSILDKLRFVHVNAPLLLQPKIHRVIEAISNSEPFGVASPILDTVKPKNSALALLSDNSDSFLALMRTLPNKHPLKEMFAEMKSLSEKLGTKLVESSEEFKKLLQGGEEALPGSQMSALAEFADSLPEEKVKLLEVQELCNILGTLAGDAHKEEKTSPVKHELPSKDVGGEKKDEEEEGIGEEFDVPKNESDPSAKSAPIPEIPV